MLINRKMNAGLELHIMPTNINSKIFSNSKIDTTNLTPNQNIDCFELGMPGSLPVLNERFLVHSIKLAKALNCKINLKSQFYNKLYRYQDLPCRQITQTEFPIASAGEFKVHVSDNYDKYPNLQDEDGIKYFIVHINRIHIEHDAGKSLYDISHNYTAIDYNRCGNGLLEIVTEPCFESMDEVVRFLQVVRNIARSLEISECEMSKGEMRADLNFSVQKHEGVLGTRVEVKNLNSFNFIYKAGLYEYNRHCNLLDQNADIKTETLSYDDKKNITLSMRAKEDALDYRYFPAHDLPILEITEEEINDVELPKLAYEIYTELILIKIPEKFAEIISSERIYSNFFTELRKELNILIQSKDNLDLYSTAVKWMIGDLFKLMKDQDLSFFQDSLIIEYFAQIIYKVHIGDISGKSGKFLLELVIFERKSPMQMIIDHKLQQISDHNILTNLAQEILTSSPKDVDNYKSGKKNLIGVFVSRCLIKMPNANPNILQEIIKIHLN